MIREVNYEILRILLVAAGAAFLGFLLGYPVSALVLGLCCYILWVFFQIVALARWVASGGKDAPPISSGIFEFIIERLFRIQREHQQAASQLEQERDRYLSLIADVRDGVVLIQTDGRIEWFNDRASELLGLSAPNDLGARLSNFVRAPEFVNYFSRGDFSDSLTIASPTQSGGWLELSVSEYENGESLILIRDISRVQLLEIARRDFVANLSHELRTPLTVLKGYLETMQLGNNPAPIANALEEMSRQSSRMSSLLIDLTTLSRLESIEPPIHRQCISVAGPIRQICQEAISLHTANSEQQPPNLELQLDESLTIRGDSTELYSAFSNLVVNALKYGQGKIVVSWQKQGSGAAFSVTDSGPGISPRHLSRLTERFYRVDSSRNSDTGGTGLGLAIVKHVLLRHDGELQIDSVLGKGSSFKCLFPHSRICETSNEPSAHASA